MRGIEREIDILKVDEVIPATKIGRGFHWKGHNPYGYYWE